MEINITSFVQTEDPYDYSASRYERGDNAGRETWEAALNAPTLLSTPEQIEALRDYTRSFGAWEDEEIEAWDDEECNALFVQLVSGNMREAGMDEGNFNWERYESLVERGDLAGSIYRGADGQVYFYLGS
jgi:hypothetical protein